MNSRPGIFVALVLGLVLATSAVSLLIFESSRSKQPEVSEQSRQYEAAKAGREDLALSPTDNSQTGIQEAEASTAEENQAAQEFTVFFSKNPESSDDLNKVFPVSRATNESVLKSAVGELIAGPTKQEKDEGYFGGLQLSGDSNCDGQEFKLEVVENRLTLTFCKDLAQTDKEELSRAQNQIIATLKSTGLAESFLVLDKDGKCLFGEQFSLSCR